MNEPTLWREGDRFPEGDGDVQIPDGEWLVVTDAEVESAWAITKRKLEAKGWHFRDVVEASASVVEFGLSPTKEKGLQTIMDSFEEALRLHLGPRVAHGVVLILARPTLLDARREIKKSYVRARFGFEAAS